MKQSLCLLKIFLVLTIFGVVYFAGSQLIYGQDGTITYPTTSPSNTPTPSTTTSPSGGGNIVQPSPEIVHPQRDSRLSGNVVVEIFINATVVLEMNVYAVSSTSKNLYLGTAHQTQGTYYQLWWDTKNVVNGEYWLYASAKLSSGIKTYSGKIHVLVGNEALTSTQTTDQTSTDTGQVENTQGTETQITENNQTKVIAKAPQTSVPVATPPPASASTLPQTLLENSRLLTTVNFSLDQDKPLHLERIEGRLSATEAQFLVLAGKSYPHTNPLITINSQPLVLSAAADASGNWSYTLENPLEPGKHEVYVEVNLGTTTEKSGPYPFSVAKAQASVDNPTGASLELVDPQKQALKTYLYIAAGLIGLAILIIAIYFYIKHIHSKAQTLPIKEP